MPNLTKMDKAEEITTYLKEELKGKTRPLVVILGTTGSGKTSLSVELAKKLNGEIVSSDSRQIYKKNGHRYSKSY